MQRREFIATIGAAAATWSLFGSAKAQQKPKVGFLSSLTESKNLLEFFKQGLRNIGYIEGRDVLIETRWAGGQYEKLAPLAQELLKQGASVVVATGGVPAARAAIAATTVIPIVFLIGPDPKELGLVARINRPGANATGATFFSTELAEKRGQILYETIKSTRDIITFALIVNPGSATTKQEVAATKSAAAKIDASRLRIMPIEAKTESEIKAALSAAANGNVAGLLFSADPFFNAFRRQIVPIVAQYRIPAMYAFSEFVEAGGLMSYGAELAWGYRTVGDYTGRILRGERPGDLPIRSPDIFNLVINQTVANELGLVVSPQILAIANKVIE
jgi:putative ABC transport system substrate-binding protein